MPDEATGPQPSGSGPHRALGGERRVLDHRQPWRVWVPTYVIRRFGALLGPHGLSVYLSLAWHLTREAPNRWPSIRDVSDQVGCSRSTVERSLRRLRELELLETWPCIDAKGQHSNFWVLIDPPSEREQSDSHGKEDAGAITETGGRRPTDGAPLSTGQGGAVPPTAPSIENGSEEEREKNSPSPVAAPAEDPANLAAAIGRICAHWLAQLPVLAPSPRAQHAEEIGVEAGELLRRGWTPVQLIVSIDKPQRDRMEWPRQWRSREHSGLPRPTRKPPNPAEVAHKRNAQREEVEKEQSRPEYQEQLALLRARIGKRVDSAPPDPGDDD